MNEKKVGCSHCDYTGKCRWCRGTGKYLGENCSSCEGTGACYWCSGETIQEINCPDCYRKCPHCPEIHIGKCPKCTWGGATCSVCDGTGTCPTCSGTGKIPVGYYEWVRTKNRVCTSTVNMHNWQDSHTCNPCQWCGGKGKIERWKKNPQIANGAKVLAFANTAIKVRRRIMDLCIYSIKECSLRWRSQSRQV